MENKGILINDLSVIYNQGASNEVYALKKINVKIFPQEYIIIHGPSGCGKSTLLYSIAGLQTPTEGEVIVENDEIHAMSAFKKAIFRQQKIGMIFQAFHLIPSLTILNNVVLPLVFVGVPYHKRKERGIELLRRFGIAEQKDKFPSQLSGGQKQRVAIARALVNNPDIILADEPVGNLDSISSQNVLKILKELNEIDKKTIVMVTHNKDNLRYADRILHMKDGEIIDFEINENKKHNIKIDKEIKIGNLSNELRLLIRSFRDLSYQQVGMLVVPYKAKQLVSHVLSSFTHEQIKLTNAFVKEFLANNISLEDLIRGLDMDINKGGAGWNKQRAKRFSLRVKGIIEQANNLKTKNLDLALTQLRDYLLHIFKLDLDRKRTERLEQFLKLRVNNQLDLFQLEKRLDAPYLLGGVGLYKGTARKISREVEIIMLIKYSDDTKKTEKLERSPFKI